eukprot:1155234-Pelagomonas_calceolata.AAC.1
MEFGCVFYNKFQYIKVHAQASITGKIVTAFIGGGEQGKESPGIQEHGGQPLQIPMSSVSGFLLG